MQHAVPLAADARSGMQDRGKNRRGGVKEQRKGWAARLKTMKVVKRVIWAFTGAGGLGILWLLGHDFTDMLENQAIKIHSFRVRRI